jgi:hypothetical protein
LATVMYEGDSNGNAFPLYDNTTGYANNVNGLWMGDLITYDARVEQVRLCPAAAKTNNFTAGASSVGACDTSWWWYANPLYLLGSYGFNGWMYSGDSSQIAQYRTDVAATTAAGYIYTTESTVLSPSKTPVVCDQVWVDFWPMETDRPNVDLYTAGGTENPPSLERCLTPRHGSQASSMAPRNYTGSNAGLPGGIVVATLDGHASYTPLPQVWQYYWHQNWKLQ